MRFDDARNWQLVESWLTDAVARVQYVFVSKPVRNRLLVEARRRGVAPQLLRKAAAVLIEPKRGEAHADHFHVRIYCPTGHRPRCRDGEPYWPWYEGQPPDGAHAPLPTVRWRPTGR
jgi:penicillin-insensitive murein endopeptidase